MKRSSLSSTRRIADLLRRGLLVRWVLARTVRWWTIRRLFRRSAEPAASSRERSAITIVQSILSGDSRLAATLRTNATLGTTLPVRWHWSVDREDSPGGN